MFRVFGIIAEIWAIAAFILGLLVAFYIYTLTLDTTLSPSYTDAMSRLLLPFIEPIREKFGVTYTEFKGHKIELSLGLLAMICFVGFAICQSLSTLLYRVDNLRMRYAKEIKHKLFKLKTRSNLKAIAGMSHEAKLESGALVGIGLENFSLYPELEKELEKQLSRLDSDQKLYTEDIRLLLRFGSTVSALHFVQEFCARCKSQIDVTLLDIESVPIYRVAVQSIEIESSLAEAEKYIWSLLRCVGTNQTFLSPLAKEQLDIQSNNNPALYGFDVTSVGEYSLSNKRTFSKVYRLKFDSSER